MPRKRRPHRRRRRRGSLGPLLRVISVLLTAVAVVAALTLFFKVDQVLVTGNSRYTQEEITEVSQIRQGDNLILLDKYSVAQRIYTELPYITDVRMSRKLPDTLVVEVTETAAVASIRSGSTWWLMSAKGKLLEATNSTAAKTVLQIQGVEAQEAVASGTLALPEESHMSQERLMAFIQALAERGMLSKCSSLDLSDPRQLVLGYDGRFRVEIAYDADFDFKLNCLLAAVAQLEPNERGTIRMTLKDNNEVRLIPDAS